MLTGMGINGLALAGTYFSGGTLALTGVSEATAVAGTTTIVIGAGAVSEGISKMGAASGTVSYSFANNYGNRQDVLYPNGKYVSSPKHTPEGKGGWHGYKIKGTELTDKKGGADVLRNWLKEGKISNSQYNKLRRGK